MAAEVVCRQLGHRITGNYMLINIQLYKSVFFCSGAAVEVTGRFGSGIGPVFHNVYCTGSEQRMLDCESEIGGVPSCTIAAGVICLPGIMLLQ